MRVESGIYKIINTVTDKFYIGSATDLNKRKNRHLNELRNGKHGNSILQRAFNKYGEDSFGFVVLETTNDKNKLREIEQRYLDSLRPFDRSIGYNICQNASNQFGVKRSYKWKQLMSDAHRGKVVAEETKRKISESNKNPDKDTRVKMGAANIGNKYRLGKPMSEFTRQKLLLANVGKKLSEETKIKLSQALRGRKQRQLQCPHCDKKGGVTMYRWHFDNCKIRLSA